MKEKRKTVYFANLSLSCPTTKQTLIKKTETLKKMVKPFILSLNINLMKTHKQY